MIVINPDEESNHFDKLGILRQNIPENLGKIEPSPWGIREEITKILLIIFLFFDL